MKNSLLCFFLSLLILSSCQQIADGPKAPHNVVIIFTDDQGYEDVACFGSRDITTPNLDKMASEGIKLTHFYAAQAVCSASRAALLTGCYPNRLGIHGAYMPKSRKGLHPSETTLAEMLKAKGYATGIFGKWHLGDHPSLMPTQQGFDEFFGIPYSNDMWPYHPQQGPVFNFDPLPLYENEQVIDTLEDQSFLTTEITERSVQFIERHKDRPFFLYVPHPQPHVPLFVSEKFRGKSKRGLYGDVIMEIDWSVGEILKALENNGLDENTLVIFTSDNGPWLSYGDHAGSAGNLREGKGTAWEGGQREPFIARLPKILPAGKEISAPMMAIDILPTIAHATGTTLPKAIIDGQNAWDLWTGASDQSPQQAYFFYYKTNELHGVRYQNWKLYYPHSYRSLNGRSGGSNGQPVDYEQLALNEIELYDLQADPAEKVNVAEENPDIIKKINSLSADMRFRLGDALTQIEGTENRLPAQVPHE